MGLFGKRRDTSQWPSAVALIDEVGVDPDWKRVEGSGCFTVNGEYYSVLIEREFKSAGDAEEWAKRLQTAPNVTIRYNPKDPSDNIVEDS